MKSVVFCPYPYKQYETGAYVQHLRGTIEKFFFKPEKTMPSVLITAFFSDRHRKIYKKNRLDRVRLWIVTIMRN